MGAGALRNVVLPEAWDSSCLPICTCLVCLRWQVLWQQALQVLCSVHSPPALDDWGDGHLSDGGESPPRSQMTFPFLVSERGKTKGWT